MDSQLKARLRKIAYLAITLAWVWLLAIVWWDAGLTLGSLLSHLLFYKSSGR